MKLKTLFLSIITCFTVWGNAQIIDTVILKGLTKTSPEYIRGLIDCKKGKPFNVEALKYDEQLLNNLNLFFSVQSDYQADSSQTHFTVYLIIEESTYIYPLVLASGFKDAFKLQAGLSNINLKGEQKTIGFLYQYYDRHSFSAFYKVPRHKNNKTGHDIYVGKYSTVEPLYFGNTVSSFNFDNYSIALNGRYWFTQKLKLESGVTPIYERYQQMDNVEIPLNEKEFEFMKFRLNFSIDYNNLNYRFERINGLRFNIYGETIQTHKVPMASFFMLRTNLIKHYKFKKKGNFSIRHSFGVSTNTDSPFSPFVLDGFLNLRGIGNRVARGTGIQFINTEYRHTVYTHRLFLAQLIGFVDAGNLRPATESWQTLFNPNYTNVFTGLGIRLHARKVYKTILRLDYGVKVSDSYTGGFSFGIDQFF